MATRSRLQWTLLVMVTSSTCSGYDRLQPRHFMLNQVRQRILASSFEHSDRSSLNEKLDDAFSKWDDYKDKYDKYYSLSEEPEYLETFLANYLFIKEQYEENYGEGNTTVEVKLNSLVDLPFYKYRNMIGSDIYIPYDADQFDDFPTAPLNYTPPAQLDWRTSGRVTPVRDQGKTCNSCWAFAATGAIEGLVAKPPGKLVSLSPQNLLDCSFKYGNSGCEKGSAINSYDYVTKYGINSEMIYPYKGTVDSKKTCRFQRSKVAAKISGFERLRAGDENALLYTVAQHGPVSILVDARPKKFQAYPGGVYKDRACSSKTLNHSVLVIGYGTDAKEGPFWLIKNSWGSGWGEHGFMRLARNAKNLCGVATEPSYPVLNKVSYVPSQL